MNKQKNEHPESSKMFAAALSLAFAAEFGIDEGCVTVNVTKKGNIRVAFPVDGVVPVKDGTSINVRAFQCHSDGSSIFSVSLIFDASKTGASHSNLTLGPIPEAFTAEQVAYLGKRITDDHLASLAADDPLPST